MSKRLARSFTRTLPLSDSMRILVHSAVLFAGMNHLPTEEEMGQCTGAGSQNVEHRPGNEIAGGGTIASKNLSALAALGGTGKRDKAQRQTGPRLQAKRTPVPMHSASAIRIGSGTCDPKTGVPSLRSEGPPVEPEASFWEPVKAAVSIRWFLGSAETPADPIAGPRPPGL